MTISLDEARMTRSILAAYRSAGQDHLQSGLAWYGEALDEARKISAETGYALERVVIAMAHLSPRTQWARNLRFTWRVCRGESRPTDCLSRGWTKALEALSADDPWSTFGKGATKTRAFAQAILGDPNAVVVDVWACRAAGVDIAEIRTPKGYARVADAYRRAAKRVGMSPRELQASTWVAVRGRAA